MQTIEKRIKKPSGYCAQIARIVGTSRHYVSQVLSNPDNNNGKQAEKIKQAAVQMDAADANIKAALLAAQSQNTMV